MNAITTRPARGLYADVLPERRPALRELVAQAITTHDAFSGVLGRGQSISDEEYNRADEAAFDARRALFDHLLNEHGITASLANRLGEVLL